MYLDPRKTGDHVYGEYSFECVPFYVGKGSNSRAYHHLYGANDENFDARIKEIVNETGNPPLIIFHAMNLIETNALSEERKLTKAIGRINKNTGPLYNLVDGGGSGMTGFCHSDYTKNKIRNSLKGRKYGPPSEATRKKISESFKRKRLLHEPKNPKDKNSPFENSTTYIMEHPYVSTQELFIGKKRFFEWCDKMKLDRYSLLEGKTIDGWSLSIV